MDAADVPPDGIWRGAARRDSARRKTAGWGGAPRPGRAALDLDLRALLFDDGPQVVVLHTDPQTGGLTRGLSAEGRIAGDVNLATELLGG